MPSFKLVTALFNLGNELSSNFLTDGNSFHFWHNKSECFLFSLPNQEKINPPKVRPCCKECYLFIFFFQDLADVALTLINLCTFIMVDLKLKTKENTFVGAHHWEMMLANDNQS